MSTFKIHLAKQIGTKQTTKINMCGRGYGVDGSIRIYTLDRFMAVMSEKPEHCCTQCIASAKAKGVVN